jgi:hypothetical protein
LASDGCNLRLMLYSCALPGITKRVELSEDYSNADACQQLENVFKYNP